MDIKEDIKPTAVEKLDNLLWALSKCNNKSRELKCAYWDGKITFNEYMMELQNLVTYGEIVEEEYHADG